MKNRPKRKRFDDEVRVRVARDLRRSLEVLAELDELDLSDIVRQALRNHVQQRKQAA